MTTLWVADAVFLLFIMPIWLRINRSIREYAETADHEDPQVFNDDIELEDQKA